MSFKRYSVGYYDPTPKTGKLLEQRCDRAEADVWRFQRRVGWALLSLPFVYIALVSLLGYLVVHP